MFGTQYSNQIVTRGQMAPGGDFETVFSFTHRGMCALFAETYEQFDITVFDPTRDAERRGLHEADFDTPALVNRQAQFDVMHRHVLRYLALYYASDAALANDAAIGRWVQTLDMLVPNGVRPIAGERLTMAGVARLCAALIYMATVEHEIVGTGMWCYQLWTHVQPVRMYEDDRREPLDVYQRLVNANFNLNVHRTQLLEDWSRLALDDQGAAAFRQFRSNLQALAAGLDRTPRAPWMISPSILEANINA